MASGGQQFGGGNKTSVTLHSRTTFTHSDFLSGSKVIGVVGANCIISRVVVEITTPFDSGSQITIGTQLSQGLLLTAIETDVSLPTSFESETNYVNPSSQTFSVFLIGSPSAGSANVYLFYS
jgi:hypothetical protein